MLRKANETKRQIIESLNRRLINENKSLDDKLYLIVRNAHQEMYQKIGDVLRNDKELHITHLNPDILDKIEKSEESLSKFLSDKVKQLGGEKPEDSSSSTETKKL